ncbi:MAG: hypothetical protein Q7K55_01975 [Candidatus Levybacteria bacterium]|nr:hypothetical protein [Candidatus Levybacteria bacterium]
MYNNNLNNTDGKIYLLIIIIVIIFAILLTGGLTLSGYPSQKPERASNAFDR